MSNQPEITLASIKPGREGWVYLVHAEGTNRYKIGRSVNPVVRAKDLEKQSPYPLRLVKTFHTPDCVADEASLHEKFSSLRVHGEWFDLPPEKVNRYVEVLFYSNVLFSYREFFWQRYSQTSKWLRHQSDWADGSQIEEIISQLVELTIAKGSDSTYWLTTCTLDALLKEADYTTEAEQREVFFTVKGVLMGILATLIVGTTKFQKGWL